MGYILIAIAAIYLLKKAQPVSAAAVAAQLNLPMLPQQLTQPQQVQPGNMVQTSSGSGIPQSAAAMLGSGLDALGVPGGAAIGASIAALFKDFHAGQKVADSLVYGYQNPLGNYLDQLSAAWVQALHNGTATVAGAHVVQQLAEVALQDFSDVATQPQFTKDNVGQRGIATVTPVVETMIASINHDITVYGLI